MNQQINNFANLENDYFEIIDGREWMDNPEHRLIWAIIERAVRDALGNQSAEVVAASEWLWEESMEIFSFDWCCEILGIEPQEIRTKVLRMRSLLKKTPLAECTAIAA